MFCRPVCLLAGVQRVVFGLGCGDRGGGGCWPALAPFLLSRWRHGICRGTIFFGGVAGHAWPRRHLPCQRCGGGCHRPRCGQCWGGGGGEEE